MTRTRTSLLAAMAALASAGAQAVTDEQVAALEARIAQLEAGGSPAAASPGLADKLKVNGFMSAGFGYANSGNFEYDNGLDEDVSHKADSVVGLQIEANVNDSTKAVTQLIARGTDDFDVQAEWAYVAFHPNDGNEIRVGRMRTSFYLMSEYLEVGYAYPWARPPVEVYLAAAPSSVDGVSWIGKFNTGSWRHDLTLTWGSTRSGREDATRIYSNNATAVGVVSSVADWSFMAKVSYSDLDLGNPLFDALKQVGLMRPGDQPIIYSTLGAMYDNGSLLAMSEFASVKADGIVPDTDSSYLTLGYRVGKVMPHLTYASTRITDHADRPAIPALSTQDDLFGNPSGAPDLCPLNDPNPETSFCLARVPYDPAAVPPAVAALMPAGTQTMGVALPADAISRILDGAQDSVTIGLRYDVQSNVAVKFDWSRVLDTHGTFGRLVAPDGNYFVDAATRAPIPYPVPEDEFDIYRVVVDVVF